MPPPRSWLPFAGIALLLLVAMPWYRSPGAAPEIWLGLPDWVAVAALCFVGVVALNAFAWWGAPRDDDPPEGE